MLTKVDVITEQGLTLELPLQDSSEGYLVKDIGGLEPVKATLVSSSFANVDGEQYHSSRREARNVVFKLGLEVGHTTGTGRQLRSNLYRYFMPKSTVKLRFYEDDMGGFVDIFAVVESFDCPLFAQEPEATISLMCYDPDFYDPDPVIINGVTTDDTDEMLIEYDGTVETGILFNLMVDRTLPEFTIHHRSSDNAIRSLVFEEPLSAGDVLTISTVTGAKGATLTVNEEATSSILYGIDPASNWINLFPGMNYIRVYVEETGDPIPYTIEYTTKYGGL
jgi:hypothetical protein